MPISNPYPERAIASFVLVGAMGVALFFVGTPVDSQGSETPVIAQDEPGESTARGSAPHVPTPLPAAPSLSGPTVAAVDYPVTYPVFSESSYTPRAETRAPAESAAPEPTQGPPAPAPAEPTPAPAPQHPGILTCATPVVLLNELLCGD